MEKKLTRNLPNKMIGGVAAGLADYLGIDRTVARLLFVLSAFFYGSSVLVYIILWIAMPAQSEAEYLGNTGATGPAPQNAGSAPAETGDTSGSRSAAVTGWILVGLGALFLLDEFRFMSWFYDLFDWDNISRIWPVAFIVVGVLIISSANKKKENKEVNGGDPPFSGDFQGPAGPSAQGPPPTAPTAPTAPTPAPPPTPGVPRPYDPEPSKAQEPPAPDKPDDPDKTPGTGDQNKL